MSDETTSLIKKLDSDVLSSVKEYSGYIQEAEMLLKGYKEKEDSKTSGFCQSFFLGCTHSLATVYSIIAGKKIKCANHSKSDVDALLKFTVDLQKALLDDLFIYWLCDCENVENSEILISVIQVACLADEIELRLGFQAWKFISKFLSVLHQQLEIEFCADSVSNLDAEYPPKSDIMVNYMLECVKKHFRQCLSDVEKMPVKSSTNQSGEPNWRMELKLVAIICRLIVACLRQFPAALFHPSNPNQTRAAVSFLAWTVEIQYCGGLFRQGTGLSEALLRDFETSIFIASEVALSCVSLCGSAPEGSISSAAETIINSNLSPIKKCRIYTGILRGLESHSDDNIFELWMCDDFNIYHHLFENLDLAFSSWDPSNPSAFKDEIEIPSFASSNPDDISSTVEEFLTDVTIQVCRTARALPNQFFNFLETALLQAFMHSASMGSLVAQDVWCFLARYGNADLCWQYVRLFGNSVVCLSERYATESKAVTTDEVPLRLLGRLGGLLARCVVFLSVKQQREFLTAFPLSDRQSFGATEKSILWRFLHMKISQFHPPVRALIECQAMERVSILLEQPTHTDWIMDALTCLKLLEDVSSSSLASNASILAKLCVRLLTADLDTFSLPIAPVYMVHQIDPSLRVEAVVYCLATWLPRLSQFPVSSDQNPDDSDNVGQLMSILLDGLKTACPNGLSYFGLEAISRWLIGVNNSPDSLNAGTPVCKLPTYALVSLKSPVCRISKPPSWLTTCFEVLSTTESFKPGSIFSQLASKVKERIVEMCPSVILESTGGNYSASVDENLKNILMNINCLESNRHAGFSLAQVSLARQLSDRLFGLFCLCE